MDDPRTPGGADDPARTPRPGQPGATFDEAAVRRALGAARHEEPMPAAVAGRLDDLVRQLAAERATTESAPEAHRPALSPTPQPTSRVVDLASRRRRTRMGWLAAAAAVVVGGVSAPAWWPQTESSDRGAADQAVLGRSEGDADEGVASDTAPGASQAPTDGRGGGTSAPSGIQKPQPLSPGADLAEQVQALVDSRWTTTVPVPEGCLRPALSRQSVWVTSVTWQQQPAALVALAGDDPEVWEVRLQQCGVRVPVQVFRVSSGA